MKDSQRKLEVLLKEHQPDIARLKRLFLSVHSVSDIRYTYSYLTSLKVETTHEFIMHVQAVTTAIVIGYGRLFTATTGTIKLNADAIPKHLRSTHDAIMRLRHERYAHHGKHESVETNFEIKCDGNSIIFQPKLNFIVCLGAPKEWAPLFQWLDIYMFETLQKQLDYLSKISGYEWKMPDGPAPYWIPVTTA